MDELISNLKKSISRRARNLPTDDSEQKQLNLLANYEIENDRQKLGYIGKFFGSDQEKAGNIACLSIVLSIILIPLIIFIPINDENISKDRFLLVPSNIITLALGYLFGKR